MELQRLIEKSLRDYEPTVNKPGTLQLEMLDSLGRKALPAEEKLSLFNAGKLGFDILSGPKLNANGEGHNNDLPVIPAPQQAMVPLSVF